MPASPHADSFAVALIVLAVLVITVVAFAQIPPSIINVRLLGTWQSDAERTIADLRKTRPISNEQLSKLRELFGRLRVTYTADGRWISQLDDDADGGRYRIIHRDATSLTLHSHHDQPTTLQQLGIEVEPTRYLIQFDGDQGYWLTHGNDTSREYFRRTR